jgi:phospholipid transport system substrate-binding protein
MTCSRWGKKAAAFASFFLAACLLGGPASADRGDDGRRFVETLADRAIQSLTTGDVSRDERIHRFRQMFDENFAADAIGKWVLGRNWQQATPDEQTEYLKLFKDYIVASYVDRFAAYTGEKLQITKVLAKDGEPITVFSEILRPDTGKTPVRVDWRMEGSGQQIKIVDLVVEGVSMSTTLRSDFGSIIRRDGGLPGLLKVLREKTATLR